MKRRIFVDMDGTLAEWKDVELETLYEQGYYANLKPNETLLQEIRDLIRKGEDVYILSSFLNDSKYALSEKQQWLNRYLPEIPNAKRIFVKYGDNKTDYIPNKISNNDYLIDDYTKNLLEWKEAGGTGIKILNGINHTKGTWKGFMLSNNENISEKLETILLYPECSLDKFNEKYIELYSNFINFIEEYREAVNRPLHELLNAEIKMQDAKMEFLKERDRLLEYFEIEEKSRWFDEGDTVVHYQVNFKNGKPLYDGYIFLDLQFGQLTNDIVINSVLSSNVTGKIDINTVSKETKSFVKDILATDHEGSVRLYADDLLASWDMDGSSLANKMREIERELNDLGISKLVDIYYTGMGYINYIDINSSIISEFDFTKEYHSIREKKIFDYTVNGKDVRCELEYNEQLKGYSVKGYTIDKENRNPEQIQQVLTNSELDQIQYYLLNDINKLYNEEMNREDIDIDIADDF